MVRARRTLVLNTVEFVRETFGPDAHARVLEALPARHATTFRGEVREASWDPVEDIVAYMETAQRLLAPEDGDFHRKVGYFAGRRDRAVRAFGVMVSDLETATRMATVLWRMFFDEGRLVVAERDTKGATLRIHDFPTHAVLCRRIVGSLEGLLSDAAAPVRVVKNACVLDGRPYCELRLDWEPTQPAS